MPVPKPEWLEACRAEAEVRRKLPDLPIVLSSHARKRAKYRLRISPEEVEARIRASERTFRSDDTHWVVSLGLFEALLVFCPSYPPRGAQGGHPGQRRALRSRWLGPPGESLRRSRRV